MLDLEWIYRETLRLCAPDHLVARVATPGMPRNVVAIGKSAGALLDGFARIVRIDEAIAAVPRGYPAPAVPARVMWGGHPAIDDDSFRAGDALLAFADAHHDVTFLVSGGGSACAEVPLRPFFSEGDVAFVNRSLTTAGLPIRDINVVRRHLSALKGGRLGARVRGRSVTLVYSDVATGDLASVASGPTLSDASTRSDAIAILERIGGCDRIVTILRDLPDAEPVPEFASGEAVLVADNTTLVDAAAAIIERRGGRAVRLEAQVENDVGAAARELAEHALRARSGEIIVAGGEPTVHVRGGGRGGRCLELAVRFALEIAASGSRDPFRALFAASDGVDGNSGVAGVTVDLPAPIDRSRAESLLAVSDSLAAAAGIGRPIIIPATGNNLRDLYLMARA